MALLDTTVYVDIRGRGGAKRQAEAVEVTHRLLRDAETLVTSRINVAEIYVGLALSADPANEKQAMENFFAWVAVLEFDDAAAAPVWTHPGPPPEVRKARRRHGHAHRGHRLGQRPRGRHAQHRPFRRHAGIDGELLRKLSRPRHHSTVTLFARFRGLSTLHPRARTAPSTRPAASTKHSISPNP